MVWENGRQFVERNDKRISSSLREVVSADKILAVAEGRLDFGTWGRIFYGEFDGRRRKGVPAKIIGE